MRVVVTGGAGFIGSAVCRKLAATPGFQVLNLDKLTYAASLSSLEGLEATGRYEFVHGDICDLALLDRVFSGFHPDAVMHLAAETHVDRSIAGPAEFIRTNIEGVYALLEAARRYWTMLDADARDRFRFLNVSTDEVYGSLGATGAFCEDTAYDPRSPYSASKAAADHLVSAWGHTYGLPVLISNCSNNYGPYQFPEKLIPVLVINALEGRPLPIYGDGLNVRDWLHVEDHVEALLAILSRGRSGQTYNVGGGNERSNITVAETICDIIDELQPDPKSGPRRRLIKFAPDRPGHDRRYAIDASKVMSEIGWRAAHTFETGLRETVTWYLQRRDWWEPLRKRLQAGQTQAESMTGPS